MGRIKKEEYGIAMSFLGHHYEVHWQLSENSCKMHGRGMTTINVSHASLGYVIKANAGMTSCTAPRSKLYYFCDNVCLSSGAACAHARLCSCGDIHTTISGISDRMASPW